MEIYLRGLFRQVATGADRSRGIDSECDLKGQVMIIGVPKEVKDQEWRVGIVPSGVKALVDAGHKVLVQAQAGEGSSMPDAEYKEAGAEIVGSAEVVWKRADMIVKVKEPVQQEIQHFRPGLGVVTYLHVAPLPATDEALLQEKV